MNFSGLLALHARSNPDGLALADGRRRFTFQDFDALANRFATAALESGLAPGDRVAIYLPNRVEAAIALLGAMKAALLPVPLNWRLSGADLVRVVAHCDPAIVVTTEVQSSAFDGHRANCWSVDDNAQGGFWDSLDAGCDRYEETGRQGDEIANLMYTSGTTSTPKAAIHTHKQRFAIASAMAQAFRLSSNDVALAVSPLFHTSGMSVLSNAIFVGCPCILMEKWDLDHFLRMVAEEGITFMHMISTLVVEIIAAPKDRFDGLNSRVRMTWGGGHSIDPSLLEEFERRVGGVFVQGYARTEGGLAYNPVDLERRSFSHHGYANRNSAEIAIFDRESGLRRPSGATGEIAVRGDGVSPGYWDGQYLRSPALYDGGWQPTGDLGRIDEDGALTFLGRLDAMIKTGGENVYPNEVEAALLKVPGISDAVVVGVPDPKWGERIAAVIVRSRSDLTPEHIDQNIRQHIAGYKVPRSVVFVSELPRLGNQKVDLRACRDLVLADTASCPESPGSLDTTRPRRNTGNSVSNVETEVHSDTWITK